MVSPQTGLAGGRADLRPVAARLDDLLCADPRAGASCPGGSCSCSTTVAATCVDRHRSTSGWSRSTTAAASSGSGRDAWGPVVPLAEAPTALVGLALAFLARARRRAGRGLARRRAAGEPLVEPRCTRPAHRGRGADPLPYGAVPGPASTSPAPDGVLDPRPPSRLADPDVRALVVTPWRGRPGAERARRHELRPPRRYDYVADGPAIYVDSFATIRREADLRGLPADAEKLAVRMIHGSGQVDLVADLVVHPRLVPRGAGRAGGRRADPVRRPDGRHGRHRRPAAGRQRGALPPHTTSGSRRSPREWGTTRTAAAVSLWEPHLDGRRGGDRQRPDRAVPPAGDADRRRRRGRPRSSAARSASSAPPSRRRRSIALADDHGIDVPFVTVRGRRGGSAMASSAVNALAQEEE